MSHGRWRCGCYYNNPEFDYKIRNYLPVLKVSAHSTILNSTSRTTLRQSFANPSSTKAIERCIYSFPLYDGVSVVKFKCYIGNRVLQGVVKEKLEAKKTFDEAVSRGETAGLLAQAGEASDVFSTSIGNIPAGETIDVEIEYVGELQHDAEADGIRFTIPTFIAPRYGDLIATSTRSLPSNGMQITVDANMADGSSIRNIQSPSHPISVSMGVNSTDSNAEPVLTKALAELSQEDTALDKDFVLIVKAKNVEEPKAVLETHSSLVDQRAIMATLVPRFNLQPENPEIVFIVDRSGSMGGIIQMVISAMKVFLKAMTPGVKFNICSFGSKFDFLWSKSKSYDRSTLATAERHVASFSANYGGTETSKAIKATVDRRFKDIPLEMILLTDGDIWGQEKAFAYLNEQVQESKGQIRLFPLGIGTGVSHSFIQGLARAGNGFAQSVQHNERIDTRLMRMLKGALSPHIFDYTIEVQYKGNDDFEMVDRVMDGLEQLLDDVTEYEEPEKSSAKPTISLFDKSVDPDAVLSSKEKPLPKVRVPAILQAPHQLPSLFAFQRTTAYIILSPDAIQRNPVAVILRGTSPQGPLELSIPIEPLHEKGTTIHALAARKAVQDLEEQRGWVHSVVDKGTGELVKEKYAGQFSDIVKNEAVRLGTTFQVANRFCSFVAVQSNGSLDEKDTGTLGRYSPASVSEDSSDIDASDKSFTPSAISRFLRDAEVSSDDDAMGFSLFDDTTEPSEESYGGAARFLKQPVSRTGGLKVRHSKAQTPVRGVGRDGGRGGDGGGRALMSMPLTAEMPISPIEPRYCMSPVAKRRMRRIADHMEEAEIEETGPMGADVKVRILVNEQDFEGYWSPEPTVARILGVEMQKAFPSSLGEDEGRIWATVLVIEFLITKMKEEEEVWDMIVEKARSWLDGKAADVEALEAKAKELLSS